MPGEHRENFSAMGNEKVIYPDPNHPDRIRAELRKKESGYQPTERQMRGRFYLSKILHFIFPAAIPEVYAAGTKDGGYLDIEKVETDEDHRRMQAARAKTESGKHLSNEESVEMRQLAQKREQDPKIHDFVNALRKLGVIVDPTGDNYSYGSDGSFQYLDNSFTPWQINRVGRKLVKAYNADELAKAIESLAPEQKEQAKLYLERLEQLFKEEEEVLSSQPETYLTAKNGR